MANVPRLGRESDRIRYVVGFGFNPMRTRVALIHKRRGPAGAGMEGSLNGIGGAAIGRESYARAMTREFAQETGVMTSGWRIFGIIEGPTWRLYCYTTTLMGEQWCRIRTGSRSVTDEHVRKVSASRLPATVYHDVRWLVPLALDLVGVVVRIDMRAI